MAAIGVEAGVDQKIDGSSIGNQPPDAGHDQESKRHGSRLNSGIVDPCDARIVEQEVDDFFHRARVSIGLVFTVTERKPGEYDYTQNRFVNRDLRIDAPPSAAMLVRTQARRA